MPILARARSGAKFACGADEMAEALARVAREDAASLPLLSAAECGRLAEAAGHLSYRRARPIIGEGDKAVHQDFELCYDLPPGSAFHDVAAALETLLAAALARLGTPLLDGPPRLNDLILQRYAAGSAGISPHRDHLRYEDLVIVIPLSGRARFFLCAARDGRAPREVPAPVGAAVIMRAPNFAGRRDRPFHTVTEITSERLSLGLRHDVRDAPPPN